MKAEIELKVVGLTYAFENVDERSLIFDNLSFEVRRSELFGILGSSGCGKTTLLNLIAAFIPVQKGEISIDGIPKTKPNNNCIFVPQDLAIFNWKTVLENVVFGLKAKKMPKYARKSTALEYLRLVKLEDHSNKFPYQISGGMRQRLALARALAVEPKLILLDEPFSSLDWQSKREMQKEILRICKLTKQTVIFVTHDVEEAIYMADRILLLTGNGNPTRIADLITIPPRIKQFNGESYSHEFLNFRSSVLKKIKISIDTGKNDEYAGTY